MRSDLGPQATQVYKEKREKKEKTNRKEIRGQSSRERRRQ